MSLSAQKTQGTGENQVDQKEDAELTNNADDKKNTKDKKNEKEKETQQIENEAQKEGKEIGGEQVDKEKDEDDEREEEQKEEKPPDAINIDLSLLKSLYQFRSRPTLPYLLTEYGMEDKDAPVLKQKSKEKEKRKKKKSFGDDSLRDKEKDRLQEERHLQIVEDMQKLRDFYYDEYSTLLQNKVDEQRHRIRHYDQALKNKIAQEEEKSRQETHQVKQRLDRHEFVSDDSFLHDIPKTDVYHIVQLQDKLIKDGTLKTQSDLANFWERIQQPDIFYMYFKVPKSDDFARIEADYNDNASSKAASTLHSSQSNLSPAVLPKKEGARALSRITESRESSRPGTRLGQHWAITQQYPAQNRDRRRSSFTGLLKPMPVQAKPSFLQELEKRFPKLEMPKLHCFTMSLGPKPPHPDEVRHECRQRELEKNRKKYTYKLNKMHQLAMANTAAASRILEMHEDMDFIINGSPLEDLISDHHFYSGLPPADHQADVARGPSNSSPIEEGATRPLPSLLEQDEGGMTPGMLSTMQKNLRSGSSRMSKRSKKSSPKPPGPGKRLQTPIIPLSYHEVKNNDRLVSPKCISTLWTNYMKDVAPAVTGHSVFNT
ncbi:DNA ligase 1-like isoform X2 [Littorina saxatilis]|uniref:DNA ligase 1-like isoform X2 n=1 Tax=Littorina saxatilis TaxID=31220 RepID=UPI0038B5F936